MPNRDLVPLVAALDTRQSAIVNQKSGCRIIKLANPKTVTPQRNVVSPASRAL